MFRAVFFILCIILSTLRVFASVETQLYLSEDSVSIGDTTTLTLEVNTPEFIWDINYEIKWLENFEIFSRGQQFQFQNIWWEVQGNMQIKLSLRAIQAWEFLLWPATLEIWNEQYRDETSLTLVVEESNRSQVPVWEISDIDDETLYGIIENPKIFPLKILLYILWISLLVLALFYILTLLRKNNQHITENIEPESPLREKVSLYEKYFSHISADDTSQIFMEKYLHATEKYLAQSSHHQENPRALTLEEIKKLEMYTSYPLQDDLKNIYIRYYSWGELIEEEKIYYITKLKNIFTHE